MRRVIAAVAAAACVFTVASATAQIAPTGGSPIPNGLSGGATETFTQSPLGNGAGQSGSFVPPTPAIRGTSPAASHVSGAKSPSVRLKR